MREKEKWINRDIKDMLITNSFVLGNIINSGFHSSLRNAFAHSDYSIVLEQEIIYLHNFQEKDKDWALPQITFHEWWSYFSFSVL
jgi:hypothetical protein